MLKKILIFLLAALILFCSVLQVSAEEIIRYSEEYSATIDKMQEMPNTETLKEWFNIDLPLDENQNEIYTVEFNTENIKLNEIGEYNVQMTFYKNENNKFTKDFKLKVIDKIVNTDVEKIGIKYLEEILKTISITVLVALLIITIFSHTEVEKIAVIKNNKFIDIYTLRNKTDYDKKIKYLFKKMKLKSMNNILLVNKKDLSPIQLSQIKTNKKFDYALFLN